jgi:hypothetical protein
MPGPSELTSRDPREVGGYRLLKRLGAGGQGIVYLGTDGGEDLVAVKVLNTDFEDTGRLKPALNRELSSARSVAAFVTAQVIAFDLDADPPYIVTEYVEGPTLQEEVERGRGPLRGSRLADLAIQTVIALEAVHGANIVHCDFKPGNIILGPGGVKVIDFGIARAWDAVYQAASRIIGSSHFMAPEQVNNEPLGPPVDMFAWGATMVFAATGRNAFDGFNPVAVGLNIVQGEPDLHGLDGLLGDLVRACLHKDPAQRPTAAEVRQALMAPAARTGEPTLVAAVPAAAMPADPAPIAEPPTPFTGRPRRRGGAGLVGLLVLVLLLAGGGAAYLWWDRTGRGGADPAGTTPDVNVQALEEFAGRPMADCSPLQPTVRQLARRSCAVDGVQVTYSLYKRQPVDERSAERNRVKVLHDEHSPRDCRLGSATTPDGRRGHYMEYTYQAGDDQKWYVALWFDDGIDNPGGSAVMTMRREWDRSTADPARPLRETWLGWGYRLDA